MIDTNRARPPSQELMLLDLVQRLERLRAGRIGIHLHFSKLSRAYSRERYLRIAVDSFATFVSGFEGQLFQLENGDVFFLAKDATGTMLEASVERVRMLFSLDPLFETSTPRGGSAFSTWYDLEKDYDKLLEVARDLLRQAERKRAFDTLSNEKIVKKPTPLAPDILGKLEQSLETVDVTNIARRQTVCTLIDDAPPQPLFEEIFISIEDLQNIVIPGIDISTNTWLFRYLTQTLDRRIMLMLIRDGVMSSRPFSLNLNVSTILTSDFARFEEIITPQLRGRLVIEMNVLDVFSDVEAFLFARDYLHDHGFRLCLDGLTHHTLPFYNRSKLGFDLVKIFWSPAALEDILPSMIPEVRNIVMETGQANTILCRCDNEDAIRLGQDLGIVMFQGRQVDRRLTAARISAPSTFGPAR